MKKIILSTLLMLAATSATAVTLEELEKRGISERLKQALITSVEVLQESRQAQATKAAAFVTVGNDSSCTYHSGTHPIQDAINAGTSSEIRIANDRSYTENLEINNKSITLKGGYADCAAAENDTQTDITVINGVAGVNLPVIRIFGNSSRHQITIDSLRLSKGSGTGFLPGGGISTLDADAHITVKNSSISYNNGFLGGGIAIIVGNTDFSLVDTIIYSNTADIGGGIYCSGGNASVTLSGNSGISINKAVGTSGGNSGKGGGVFVTNQCKFFSYSGTAGGWPDFRGIAGNTATNQGGGVYADNGATVTLFGGQVCFFIGCAGDTTNPANLNSNRAESDNTGATNRKAGSGAFISGADTQMSIYDGRVTDNTIGDSAYHGGAIYVDAGATFTTARVGKKCWNQAHCNYYADNKAGSDNGYGGAFYNNGSTLNINNAVITGNRADWGTALYAINAGKTTIKGSLIYGNGDDGADGFIDQGVFRLRKDAELDIERSTIADNHADIVFRISSTADAANSSILASIVHDASSGNVYQNNPGLVSNDCTLFHESNSIPSLANNSFVDNPEFVDRSNANYHLKPVSPAIDFCDDIPTPVNYRDMDFEEYGYDYPTVSDNLGPYDIGADEVYNNTIFADSFE